MLSHLDRSQLAAADPASLRRESTTATAAKAIAAPGEETTELDETRKGKPPFWHQPQSGAEDAKVLAVASAAALPAKQTAAKGCGSKSLSKKTSLYAMPSVGCYPEGASRDLCKKELHTGISTAPGPGALAADEAQGAEGTPASGASGSASKAASSGLTVAGPAYATSSPHYRRSITPSTASLYLTPPLTLLDGVPSDPMTPAMVLEEHFSLLTSLEQTELKALRDAQAKSADAKDLVHFLGRQASKVDATAPAGPNNGYDDQRGDYLLRPRDHIAFRYEILDLLGKGSFGQVTRAFDYRTKAYVAIKIIRNKKRFHQPALTEVKILRLLRDALQRDPSVPIIALTDAFSFRSHLCISFELLSLNLYEYIKANKFRPCPEPRIRRIAKDILKGLQLLKSLRIIHCDLKPENILLIEPPPTAAEEDTLSEEGIIARMAIKIIDFGSSCFEHEKIYTYIQSRFYRSPEILLGLDYGPPIDMWSLGCVLAELATGHPIFPGENETDQMGCIMDRIGVPQPGLLHQCTRKRMFFDSTNQPRLVPNSKGRHHRPLGRPLNACFGYATSTAFVDMLRQCFVWDPILRLTPADALRHPFILGLDVPPSPHLPSLTGPTSAHRSGANPIAIPSMVISQHHEQQSQSQIPSGSSLYHVGGGGGGGEGMQSPDAPVLPIMSPGDPSTASSSTTTFFLRRGLNPFTARRDSNTSSSAHSVGGLSPHIPSSLHPALQQIGASDDHPLAAASAPSKVTSGFKCMERLLHRRSSLPVNALTPSAAAAPSSSTTTTSGAVPAHTHLALPGYQLGARRWSASGPDSSAAMLSNNNTMPGLPNMYRIEETSTGPMYHDYVPAPTAVLPSSYTHTLPTPTTATAAETAAQAQPGWIEKWKKVVHPHH